MGKLLRILIVHRQGLADRWWHRLANVLIYGSTLIVVAFSGYLIFSSNGHGWKTYAIAAYSFESNYASAKGREIDCYFSDDLSIECGYKLRVTPSDFLTRYFKAGGTLLNEKVAGLPPRSMTVNEMIKDKDFLALSDNAKREVLNYIDKDFARLSPQVQVEVINRLKSQKIIPDMYRIPDFKNIKVKLATTILYKEVIKNILFALLLAMGWFIFWQSIVYRAVLYIAYGRQE